MFTKKKINLVVAVVNVWKGKAYIPTQAQFESGLYVNVDPVYITSLDVRNIKEAIQAVTDAGNKCIPDPKTREEFKAMGSPILKVTGARSWKQMAKNGAGYMITWSEEKKEIRIDMTLLNKKGAWEFDQAKERKLPIDTPLEEIVKIILEDVNTRPEVFG